MNKNNSADPAVKAEPGTGSPETLVWVRVIRNGAVIGDAHHAQDKRMKMPLNKAQVAQSLGDVKIVGVA
jgi:tRNA(Ser,Leu) C12 N-acetylase TAN1